MFSAHASSLSRTGERMDGRVMERVNGWRAGLAGAILLGSLGLGGMAVGLMGCGTDQPFSRGEYTPTPTPVVTPTATVAPSFTPGASETPGGGDTPTPTSATPTATPVPTSFSTKVKPLLTTCTGCHANGSGASAWTYDGGANAYSQAMLEVNVSDPPASKLLTKSSGAESHQGGTFYPTTSSGYKTILSWIEAGAPNN